MRLREKGGAGSSGLVQARIQPGGCCQSSPVVLPLESLGVCEAADGISDGDCRNICACKEFERFLQFLVGDIEGGSPTLPQFLQAF
ncbi:hypothetical protein cyc_08938 [Cyclospora cayetanensis]|uniref:Uncharacterized protein n=1 Tax=Cyclospora cayetanensis TaxID=88456 RepID=A0A1D3D407_9EIME|nr:hypothetical protein cyc_08938 [Cyclospora cayetanensis]